MPVILPQGREEEWLKSPDMKKALSLLTPCDSNILKFFPFQPK
jgi:putative SOS response-associated peptidase YedK